MSKTVKKLTTQTASIAGGNYMESINPDEYHLGYKQLSQAIKDIQKNLLYHIFEMQIVASQIDSSTTEVSDVLNNQKLLSDNIFNNSKELEGANKKNIDKSAECVQVAQSMVENTQALQTSAEQMQQSSISSKEIIAAQLNSIAQIVTIIENISETSKTSIAYINKLFNSFNKITEILATVQKFYQQTKLLSLNASIESARAGEAGAGFSVVANQIRILAENSSKSVGEISTIINEIDSDIHNVIDQSNLTQENVTNAVTNTKMIKGGLQKIEDSYLVVDQNVNQMKSKLDENLILFDLLNKTISQSSEASEMVAGEILNINRHIQTLYKKNNDILKLETNLKDTSKSLHAITDKQVNLLDETRDFINKQTRDLVDNLKDILKNNPSLQTPSTNIHSEILNTVINNSTQIEAIWTNNDTGEFIYSNPPAGISNATIRDWYNKSMEGETFISDIYISAISKNPCITISLPISGNGKIVGVIGIDIGVKFNF